MPAEARGHVRQLPSGKWQLRYNDRNGVRHSGGAFPTKTAAWRHYDETVKPELDGRPVARRDLTFSELVEVSSSVTRSSRSRERSQGSAGA